MNVWINLTEYDGGKGADTDFPQFIVIYTKAFA